MDGYDILTGRRKNSDPDCIQFPQPKNNGKGLKDGTDSKAKANPEPSPDQIRGALADNLRNMTGATFLYCSLASSLSERFDPRAFKVYRDKLLKDAGSPSDPIEIMLIEQLALAHFNIGRLQLKSCSAENSKLAIAYADAATRLFGEFRRCSLALEDFREKQAARKDRKASSAVAKMAAPAKHNGTPRSSTNGKRPSNRKKPSNGRKSSSNGKKMAVDSKPTSNGEIPQCLKDRMQPPTPAALQPAGVTGRNGKG